MRSLMRHRLLLALAALPLLGVGLWLVQTGTATAGGHNLVLGSDAGGTPSSRTASEFLTEVTQDVDAFWTRELADAGLPEPRVTYAWIPEGQTVGSACGELGDGAAAYCPGDDTIFISEPFATAIYTGALDRALPGSAQGFGGTAGDFAVAYIVAHEYGHQIQHELGLFERSVPTVRFELQADCFAGSWARSAYDEDRLEQGDLDEALNAALAVGDFEYDSAGHHGTPEQRRAAWMSGFESGDPAACTL
jgi:predicted metalloprotease